MEILDTLKVIGYENVEIVKQLGGLTNSNYLVKLDGEEYVFRIAGEGTKKFLNRKEEKYNSVVVENLNLYPKQIYFDEKTGNKITEYIRDGITLNETYLEKVEYMLEVSNVFKELHNSKAQFLNTFELKELMEHYENLCIEGETTLPLDFNKIKSNVYNLLTYFYSLKVEFSPTHIDPLCENFIWDSVNNKLYIIDFEYSAMFDPLWDVAAISLEANFNDGQLQKFLSFYFDDEKVIDNEFIERINLHRIFQDYLWYLWAAFKTAWGEDFGEYAEMRFSRLKKNLNIFMER